MILAPADLERFWSKVDRSGGPDACWPWIGAMANGYGYFWIGGRVTTAQRVALEISGVRVGKRQCGLHRCDNPPCCNPSHLWVGSHRDNARDREAKGRGGDRHGGRKLTNEQVLKIYAELGRSPQSFALEYGISTCAISNIRTGKTWRNLTKGATQWTQSC